MANFTSSSLFFTFSTLIFTDSLLLTSAADEDRQLYVVYMGSLPQVQYSPSSHHLSILQEVVEDISVSNSLVRSYRRSFNGFAAKLTETERQKLASMKDVASVFPSRTLQLATTRSWDFMGFGETVERNLARESDVIIGVIDTGIWPESESFNDKGFGPPPKKWKGACRGGRNFSCNNKIIGARYYASSAPGVVSARDDQGHGTHTASTAAGNMVKDASFYGLAKGTARGGVPSARLAAYKVCHKGSGCNDADILAAYDDAIADGVDIISISISSHFVLDFMNDSIAIGSFHAMERGIVTTASAGNGGALQGSVANVSPWMITVAASVMDQRFIDKIVLGNGKTLTGLSVNPFAQNDTKLPIVYGKVVSRKCSEFNSGACKPGCVDNNLVKGKIVLCDMFEGNKVAYLAGASGAIVQNTLVADVAFVLPLPGSSLSLEDCNVIKSYMDSTKEPQVEILKSQEITDAMAPYVPTFSGRGPSFLLQDIMKPDISAPGLEILAAYSPIASPSSSPADKRRVKFSILSGTSMACPHVAGVAAYVKSFHPDWSPSAIKSAVMTTATPMNPIQNLDQEFAYGSGHINPTKAINPGLVYESFGQDYIEMLCGGGYSSDSLGRITGRNITCPSGSDKVQTRDLNYPAMASFVPAMDPFKISFKRTVTNVGSANSTYNLRIFPSNGNLKIMVEPKVLIFRFLKEKKSFVLTISGKDLRDGYMQSFSLVWSDGTHSVRSPVVAYSMKS